MKKLLITGFAPFGGEQINPSWEAVQALPETVGSYALTKLQLPVAYAKAGELAIQAADALSPDAILCIGQAGGRSAVTPERIAINLRFAKIPDNLGVSPASPAVVPGGPDGIFATIPVEAVAQAIENAGIPAAISNTAGTYVCNDLLYLLLHHFRGTPTQVGFLHLPYLPQQAGAGQPSMPLQDMKQALTAAILAL